MSREIDALTSFTLKHLRDRWWDSDFAGFLRETLRPQATRDLAMVHSRARHLR